MWLKVCECTICTRWSISIHNDRSMNAICLIAPEKKKCCTYHYLSASNIQGMQIHWVHGGFFFPFFFLFDVDQELSEMLKCITVTDQSHGSLLFNSQILVRSVSVHLTLKAWRPVTVICLTHSSRRSFCIWIAVWIKALSKDCLVSGSGDTAAWWWEGRDSGIWWWKRYSDGWAAW